MKHKIEGNDGCYEETDKTINFPGRLSQHRSAPIGYYIEPGFREGGYGGYIKNHFPLGGDKIAYYIRLEDPLQ